MDAKLKILQDTFKNRFSMDNFLRFSREFFGDLKIVNTDRENTSIPSEYFYTVSSYWHLATYTTEKKSLDIFAVKLKSGRNIERARSMQRSFISKLLSRSNHDGAIVAFFTENDPRWRLSFIRLDYEFAAGRVKMNLTPAKRYSYLVGEKEPCHTAMEQLFPIFRDENYKPTFEKIEEAFSVERVTKDFFEQYKEKYFVLKEHLDGNDVFTEEALRHGFTSEQFAKKLMGQLAFLYFLQKKGWLGVKVLPHVLTEKAYKNAFYKTNASKEIIPKIYMQTCADEYKLVYPALLALSDNEADIAAGCFKTDGWGSGTKTFIRDLFTSCKSKNFFDEYLEPLFYEALNKKRGENSYYKRFNCKIPFLNGGLFEPLESYDWEHSKFAIPNSLFSNIDTKGDREADGILDIFDRYNFTMNEDEPLEREVAVDPEMLGKIFENLLDSKDRKSKGAFYTPREIVHYMCQESLINYLIGKTSVPYDDMKPFILDGEFMKDEDYNRSEGKRRLPQTVYDNLREIDKALENIKVADPAVGSGAFPLGMLSEIVKARNNITYYYVSSLSDKADKARMFEQRDPYRLKWKTIQNCIFAVDIEASAVDIAKLRLWLSLVVDEDLTPSYDEAMFGDNKQKDPRPLPNLDYNIMCGNSLIDEFEGVKLFDDTLLDKKKFSTKGGSDSIQMSLFVDSMQIYLDDLHKDQERLFGEQDPTTKKEIKRRIDKTIDDVIRAKLSQDNNSEGLRKYDEILKQNTKPYFLWKLEFAKIFRENGGFDVVIGNPPYIGEEGHKELFRQISITAFGKKHYIGKMDLWYFFTSKAIELIRDNGVVSFIAPNNWMTTAGGKNMRKHIATETMIKRFVTFNNIMVFESASQQTMIFVLEKRTTTNTYLIPYSEFTTTLNANNNGDIGNFLNAKNVGNHFNASFDPKRHLEGATIQFLTGDASQVITKIQKCNVTYLANNEILNGIHPHHASVTKKMLPMLDGASVGEGIFVLDNSEVNALNLSENESSLLKPCYDSKSIARYYFNPKINHQIIYTTSDFKDVKLMDSFPALKKHLDKYRSVITSDNKPYGLHRARQQDFFDMPKIVSLRKCKVPTFMYIETPSYVMAEYYLIKTDRVNMKYLVGLLNSKLIAFWMLKMGKIQGNIYQVDKEPLLGIPIFIANKEIENSIESLVEKVVYEKLNDPTADTSGLEAKIDSMVYELYGLTDEEIKIVEESIK